MRVMMVTGVRDNEQPDDGEGAHVTVPPPRYAAPAAGPRPKGRSGDQERLVTSAEVSSRLMLLCLLEMNVLWCDKCKSIPEQQLKTL